MAKKPQIMLDSPLVQADSYKLAHWLEYPEGTNLVYSNFTPRVSRRTELGISKFVFFGLQAFLDDLTERFDKFFKQPEEEAVDQFVNFYREFFGVVGCPIGNHVQAFYIAYMVAVRSRPRLRRVPNLKRCNT